MRKVLVTGGAGFIGCHLVKRLLNLGWHIRVIDKQKPVLPLYDESMVEFILQDLSHPTILDEALDGIDTCFHLAGTDYSTLCDYERVPFMEKDLHIFNGLMDVIRRMDRPVKLVYASHADVYGDTKGPPYEETSKLQPITFEGAYALHIETQAYLANIHFNIPSTGLRLFNVYGEGLEYLKARSVFVSFWRAILEHKPLMVFGQGEALRDFIYIDDVIDALIQASLFSGRDNGIFNVCTGVGTSINRLAYLLLELMESSNPIVHVRDRENELDSKVGNPLLCKRILGFHAKMSLEEGLVSWLVNYQELINE